MERHLLRRFVVHIRPRCNTFNRRSTLRHEVSAAILSLRFTVLIISAVLVTLQLFTNEIHEEQFGAVPAFLNVEPRENRFDFHPLEAVWV